MTTTPIAAGPNDVTVSRQCTCHPEDNPPKPCEMRYAFTIAKQIPQLARGQVWCRSCGRTQRTDSAEALRSGWPKCCGYTMTIDSPEEQKRLSEKTPMEWVSCTDRMPPTYETCIVGRPDVPWPITAFWTGEKWCRDVMKEEFHITHWMPMPPPPSNAGGQVRR